MDIFSRYAWAAALRSTKADEIMKAFEAFFTKKNRGKFKAIRVANLSIDKNLHYQLPICKGENRTTYNNSVHSAIDMQPSKVTEKNAFVIASRLQMKELVKKRLISKLAIIEVFIVVGVDRTRPVPTYKLHDLSGEDLREMPTTCS
ncbi:hypothetical protein J437_LFUL005139 [Ladona fulva]|uniref:Uncharacterized protein n=1 Tax=Ladona fulva TaxID=123851 RepID=A0A8K0KGK3_LADFU|nr:hypothetical protein J437_LFUL005139 [Ladona fulva]